MATPTLVQHYYSGTLSPVRGLADTVFTFPVPNLTKAGNCGIIVVDTGHGVVPSITDDQGNNWAGVTPVSADGGAGKTLTTIFVLPNLAANTRIFTVTLGASCDAIHFCFLEYANCGSSAVVVQSASATTPQHASITSGSLATTNGNLIFHYAVDNTGRPGQQTATAVTAWAKGTSFTALAGDINNVVCANSFFCQQRIADGTTFNPTCTATQGASTDAFNSIAIEIASGSSGSVGSGMYIKKMQMFTNIALSVPGNWTEFFPASGNLLVGTNIYPGSSTAVFTDSKSNTWQLAHSNAGVPMILYAQGSALVVGDDLQVTFVLTAANANTTVTLYDIAGAAANTPFVQATTQNPQNVNGSTTAADQPIITPQQQNGVVIALMGLGQGPSTGLSTPSTGLYMCPRYSTETDFDTIDNADAYGHSYFGSSLGTQHWTWAISSQVSNSAFSAAAEFSPTDYVAPTPTYFGNNLTAGGGIDSNASIVYWASFVAPASGLLIELSAYVKVSGAAGTIRLAIYDSTGTVLLAQGSATVPVSSASYSWVGHTTAASLGSISLQGGTTYILALSNTATAVDLFTNPPGGSGSFLFNATNETGGYPASLPAGSALGETFSIRAGIQAVPANPIPVAKINVGTRPAAFKPGLAR